VRPATPSSATRPRILVVEDDAEARSIWEDAVAACAAGVCNLVMAFAPSAVIVGGGIGRRPDFFEPLREIVLQRKENRPTPLSMVACGLGDDAGLAGAAAWIGAMRPHG